MINKKEEQDYVIRIIGNEDEFLQITDLQNRYKGKIHKYLIKDNQFEMLDPKCNNIGENCYNVGKSCFLYWLKNDIETETKRIKMEQFNLFYLNISLFEEEENKKMILSNPNFYSIVAPERFYGMMYCRSACQKITLGELLQIWKKESIFSTTCQKCEGKARVYHFGGNPLSGLLCVAENICVKCGNKGNGAGTTGSFGTLWQTRRKYRPIEPIAENPELIESLIENCKKMK